MRTLVLYDSLSGNTEKIARAIHETVLEHDLDSELVKIDKGLDLDFFDYDLVFAGAPVIDWLPTKRMMDFIMGRMKHYNSLGLIKPASPIIPGKFGVCFGTFGGPHIGEREAQPMTAWLRSFMEHLGYIVLDSWHVIGQFVHKEDMNSHGRLGNIQYRPHAEDVLEIRNRVTGLLASLEAWRQ